MAFSVFITAFGSMLALGLLALRVFPALKLLDKPHKYGLERSPIPYPGGLAMFFAFLITAVSFLSSSPDVNSVLLGASLLVLVSFVDDRHGLPPALRLLIQAVAAGLLVLGGIGISSITNPFGDSFVLNQFEWTITLGELQWTFTLFADLLTVAWVLIMVNAFNWIDGVPGMANSVAAVAAAVLLTLSLRDGFHSTDQTVAIVLSALVLGLSLGHLLFDFPPPRMILGDTGSMLLGFLLAVSAIISGGKIATTLLVLGFPLLDFFWVIGRRLLKGQSPFKGDLWHFHHRLLRVGFSEQRVVIFFAVTAAMFGGLALMLHTEGKAIAFGGIVAIMLILGTLLYTKKK